MSSRASIRHESSNISRMVIGRHVTTFCKLSAPGLFTGFSTGNHKALPATEDDRPEAVAKNSRSSQNVSPKEALRLVFVLRKRHWLIANVEGKVDTCADDSASDPDGSECKNEYSCCEHDNFSLLEPIHYISLIIVSVKFHVQFLQK